MWYVKSGWESGLAQMQKGISHLYLDHLDFCTFGEFTNLFASKTKFSCNLESFNGINHQCFSSITIVM